MCSEPPLTRQQPSRRGTVGYGGQAVTEGVMIRSPHHVVVVCRRSDGTLARISRQLGTTAARRVRRIPLLRGAITLLETLWIGWWALRFAQRVSMRQELLEHSRLVDAVSIISMALAMSVAVGGFFLAPVFATRWIADTAAEPIWAIVAEGFLRVAMLLAWLTLMGRLPDVRRVFQFHGAEHKAIAAWEAGDELTPERVARYSRAHPRCGTSFTLVVALIAIPIFVALGNPPLWWHLLSRIILLPLLTALAYEVIRFGGMHRGNRLIMTLFAPNLWLQALTTREPDREQIGVAIAAMEAALELEGERA